MAPNPDLKAVPSGPPSLEDLLRTCPELSRSDLEYLEDWMSKQPHLPKISQVGLVPYLHSNYYSLEGAKRTIENYFTIRTHAPDIFQNLEPLKAEEKKHLDMIRVACLSKRDPNGYKVIATHMAVPYSPDFSYEAHNKVFFMMTQQWIRDDPTCPGYVLFMNLTNVSMGHIVKASISTVKMVLTYIQEGLPLRMKAVHICYVNPLVDTIMMLIKPFLQDELRALLHFHSGEMEEFYKEFPRDMLPKQYGGELGCLNEMHAVITKNMEEDRSWYMEQQKLLVDESRRPGKARSAGDVFGVEGSFKKLVID